MMNLVSRMRGVAVAVALVAVVPALAATTSSDYDHSVNFRSYKTFSFYKVQTSDPFFEQRVKDQVTRDLTKAGLERVDSGGDLQLTAIGHTKEQQEYNTFYDGLGNGGFGYGGWGGWGGGRWGGFGGGGFGNSGVARTTVQTVPIGTLMLDMYDAKSKQLVWRGKATDRLSNKPEKNVGKLNKNIDHMLNGFPPKFKD